MTEKKPDDIARPVVLDRTTGKPMTNEELEIADVQRRQKSGKCVKKCNDHHHWCALKYNHHGSCFCDVCKKEE